MVNPSVGSAAVFCGWFRIKRSLFIVFLKQRAVFDAAIQSTKQTVALAVMAVAEIF
jgi:hypothetical protein